MDIHRSNINTNDMAYVTVSHADRTVSVWTLSSVGQFNKIFNIQIQPPFKIPQSVKFDEYRNVNVFAGGGGMIVKLDRQTGAVVTQRVISKLDESRMGSVALDEARDQLIVNTSNTCEVFTFSDLKHRATLPSTAPTVVTYPRQMTLIEDGSRLVSGTDSGHAVVYNLDRYTVEQKLVYPKGGLVQPVASFGDEAWTYIVIAGSTGERSQDVLLFRRSNSSVTKRIRQKFASIQISYFTVSAIFLVVGLTLGLVSQRITIELPTIVWKSTPDGAKRNASPTIPAAVTSVPTPLLPVVETRSLTTVTVSSFPFIETPSLTAETVTVITSEIVTSIPPAETITLSPTPVTVSTSLLKISTVTITLSAPQVPATSNVNAPAGVDLETASLDSESEVISASPSVTTVDVLSTDFRTVAVSQLDL
ncbi:hypothetical protein AAF712_011630 [Marasmius tenuissimus]|uniref:Uncharacterized protein n=1 Tax=Marasmius tenuissimus TaxID=585030 RepID=A0ABR2ZJN5_9AGAR